MRNKNANADPFKDFIASVDQIHRDAPDHFHRCQYFRDQDQRIKDASRILGPAWRNTPTENDWAAHREQMYEDRRAERIERLGEWADNDDDEWDRQPDF